MQQMCLTGVACMLACIATTVMLPCTRCCTDSHLVLGVTKPAMRRVVRTWLCNKQHVHQPWPWPCTSKLHPSPFAAYGNALPTRLLSPTTHHVLIIQCRLLDATYEPRQDRCQLMHMPHVQGAPPAALVKQRAGLCNSASCSTVLHHQGAGSATSKWCSSKRAC